MGGQASGLPSSLGSHLLSKFNYVVIFGEIMSIFILTEDPFLNNKLFDDPGHDTDKVVTHEKTDVTWKEKEVK